MLLQVNQPDIRTASSMALGACVPMRMARPQPLLSARKIANSVSPRGSLVIRPHQEADHESRARKIRSWTSHTTPAHATLWVYKEPGEQYTSTYVTVRQTLHNCRPHSRLVQAQDRDSPGSPPKKHTAGLTSNLPAFSEENVPQGREPERLSS